MPADKGAMHMYDTYFHYAEEAEKAGHFQEAANQYRLAAKCLYENAATSRGSARESLIRRGDLLVGIADAMEKKEKQKTDYYNVKIILIEEMQLFKIEKMP